MEEAQFRRHSKKAFSAEKGWEAQQDVAWGCPGSSVGFLVQPSGL